MLKNNARKFITKYEKFTYESVKRIDLDIFCMIYVIVWIEDNNWGPTLFEKIIWSIITNFYLLPFGIKWVDVRDEIWDGDEDVRGRQISKIVGTFQDEDGEDVDVLRMPD